MTKTKLLAQYYPVTVVGGGIIGKIMALGLDSLHLLPNESICLVDNATTMTHPTPPKGFHNRVSFITPSSVRLFKDLGIWDDIHAIQAWPIHALKFSSHAGLGYIIQNNVMEHVLNQHLMASSSVKWMSESTLANMEESSTTPSQSPSFRNLHILSGNNKTPSSFKTSLLIGADGAKSNVRAMLNLPYRSYAYDHVGIVATLKIHSPGQGLKQPLTAWQRFLSTGPIALLPLSETHASLVWSVPKSFQLALLGQSDEQFAKAVQLAFHASFSDLLHYLKHETPTDHFDSSEQHSFDSSVPPTITGLETNSRACFPLSFGVCSRSIASHSLVIGDAAHSVHPLAGQGLNMGLADVLALRNVLKDSIGLGLNPGEFQVLEQYARKRDIKNMSMAFACDLLYHTFTDHSNMWLPPSKSTLDTLSTNRSSASSLRRLGLAFLDTNGPLKNLLVKVATGNL